MAALNDNGEETFAYDKGGRPIQRGERVFTVWDGAGRVTERRIQRKGFRPITQRFEWNGSDQMVGVHIEKPGSETESWHYTFDPFGRRIGKERTSSSKGEGLKPEATKSKPLEKVTYLWDGNALVAEQKLFADGTTADVIWHYDGRTEFTPIAREEEAHVSYTISDHLGTIKEVIDEQGRAIWAQSHQLWGQPLKQLGGGKAANDDFQPFKFPGQQVDQETELYYNRFRNYDTENGYLSSDPIRLAGSQRLNSYVINPTKYADTLGLSPCTTTVINRYGPMNRGPLEDKVANSFRSGTYNEVVTNQPITLYRVTQDNGNPLGGYWTRTPPQGPLQSVIDSALDQNWGNTATQVFEMRVPAGTTLFEGVAAPQRGLVGGGNQIFFDRSINPINPTWLVE